MNSTTALHLTWSTHCPSVGWLLTCCLMIHDGSSGPRVVFNSVLKVVGLGYTTAGWLSHKHTQLYPNRAFLTSRRPRTPQSNERAHAHTHLASCWHTASCRSRRSPPWPSSRSCGPSRWCRSPQTCSGPRRRRRCALCPAWCAGRPGPRSSATCCARRTRTPRAGRPGAARRGCPGGFGKGDLCRCRPRRCGGLCPRALTCGQCKWWECIT